MSAGNNTPQIKIGSKFGRLSVIGPFHYRFSPSGRKSLQVGCKCACGSEPRLVFCFCLLNGSTRSCGCLAKEVAIESGRIIPGFSISFHPLYQIWRGIMRRCYEPKNKSYKYYGAVGVKVCEEWKSVENFYSWAVSKGWEKGLSIDRFPHKSGDYGPKNCRIATPKQQANNRRDNLIITAFGETKTISAWLADSRCVVSKSALRERVLKLQINPEIAITEPANINRPRGIDGKLLAVGES